MGYQDPPKSGQIRPGEVRNGRGRPKGSRNRKTIVRDIASQRHTVTIEGERKRVTALEVLLLRLQYHAIKKGGRALKEFNRLVETYDIDGGEKPRYGVLVVPPEMSAEEFADIRGMRITDRAPPPFMKVLYEVYCPEVFNSSGKQENK